MDDGDDGCDGFDGPMARFTGAVMARLNRDMERAAVDELDPGADDHALAVGFGPGVGVAELLVRMPGGRVCGVDPSAAMVGQARRRNRAGVRDGRAELVQAPAEAIPFGDGAFDGAVAVNCAQLWDSMDDAVRELARVVRAGGGVVTVTHVWAIEKRAPLGRWVDATGTLLERCGFADVAHRTATFRSGAGLVLRARRRPDAFPGTEGARH